MLLHCKSQSLDLFLPAWELLRFAVTRLERRRDVKRRNGVYRVFSAVHVVPGSGVPALQVGVKCRASRVAGAFALAAAAAAWRKDMSRFSPLQSDALLANVATLWWPTHERKCLTYTKLHQTVIGCRVH